MRFIMSIAVTLASLLLAILLRWALAGSSFTPDYIAGQLAGLGIAALAYFLLWPTWCSRASK